MIGTDISTFLQTSIVGLQISSAAIYISANKPVLGILDLITASLWTAVVVLNNLSKKRVHFVRSRPMPPKLELTANRPDSSQILLPLESDDPASEDQSAGFSLDKD